ncbi:MAG: alpha/beta hydrolase, partial [Thermoleophilaceae bacterium]
MVRRTPAWVGDFGWTRGLFVAGVAVVALHAIDDSFVHPQPGTSAGDHLLGGLVPLALAALSARAFWRSRPGTRAALGFAWSLVALLSGVEAIYYAQHGGLGGDDYTGLLAMAATPILFAVATRELWQSRRTDGRRARRYVRRLAKGAIALFVVALTAVPFAVAYIGGHVSRSVVPAAALGAPHGDVTLRTSDGLNLQGWYVPSHNHAAVIVFPGRKGPMTRAQMLARHGYGVLLYDRRGEGRSEGDPDSFGWDFDKDIRAGLEFLKGRSDVDPQRIGGIGLSVGGEMMLQTAGEATDLAAVVAEGAGARTVSEEIDDTHGIDKVFAAISYGVRDLTNSVVQGRTPPTNLKRLVPKIAPRPVFFIHAGPRESGHLGPDYFRVAGRPKQIWEAQGGHTQAFAKQPREYERRVV